MHQVDYSIKLDVVSEGYDRKMGWWLPRVGIVPPRTAILTMAKSDQDKNDVLTGISDMRSDDLGENWSVPVLHPTLDRRPLVGGLEICPTDTTPAWHAKTGKLLMTGETTVYDPDTREPVRDMRFPREVGYSVYDEEARTWTAWRTVDLPGKGDKFFWIGAGAAQRVDLENGQVLLPVYGHDRRGVESHYEQAYNSALVLRCEFDGAVLSYVEHGDEMSMPVPRGLYEPSLTRFDGKFYLTLRNDERGYVTAGEDGLHFEDPRAWTFDDGAELGSHCTQQHWVTHSDGLFLVYTRKGANNDHIQRHRAPLFMARVDTERLCVIRGTESIVVPEKGATLGNFGTVNASRDESWITVAESMQNGSWDLSSRMEAERRGANNRVYVCRIRWSQPNRLV